MTNRLLIILCFVIFAIFVWKVNIPGKKGSYKLHNAFDVGVHMLVTAPLVAGVLV